MFPRFSFDDDVDDQGLDILGDVSLEYFRAEPETISPFGSSLLKWKVKGPNKGFRVKIDGMEVAKSGAKSVQPLSSQVYRLFAQAGRSSKFLGTSAVHVNLSKCVYFDNPFVAEYVKFALQKIINENPEVYFRAVPKLDPFGRVIFVQSEPEVIITPGQIRFILKLGSPVNNFPDAIVDVDARFGLAVSKDAGSIFNTTSIFGSRKVVPINVDIKVEVSVPWYAWAIPLAILILPMRLDSGREKVLKNFREGIPKLVDEAVVNFKEPKETEPHSVRIYNADNGAGIVEVTFCPVETPPIVIE